MTLTSRSEARLGGGAFRRYARRSAFRFGLLSALSFVLNLGLAVLLHEALAVPEEGAVATALLVVMANNFLFLRYYIYPARNGSALRQLVMFVGSSAAFRGLEYLVFLAGHTLGGLPYVPVLIAIQLLSAAGKFLYYGFVVFKPEEPRAAA